MKTYFLNLLEEKNIDLEEDLNIEGQINLTVGMLVEFIVAMPRNIQVQIRDTFVKIDFANGNVRHYLNFLAKGMVASV